MIRTIAVALLAVVLGATSLRAAPTVTLQEEWKAEWTAPRPNPEAQPQQLAVAPDGSVYVTGTVFRVENTKLDICTAKFGSDGKLQWVRYIDAAIPAKKRATYVSPHYYNRDEGRALAVGADGSVFVAGESGDEVRSGEYFWPKCGMDTVSRDIVVGRYDPDGNRVWLTRHSPYDPRQPRTKRFTESPYRIALDRNGGLYVCGDGTVSGHDEDTFEYRPLILKYDLDGHLVWGRRPDVRHGNSALSGCGSPRVDAEGKLHVVGYLRRMGVRGAFVPWYDRPESGIATLVYSPEGQLERARYVGLPPLTDTGYYSAVLDELCNLYIAHSCSSFSAKKSCPLGWEQSQFWSYDCEGRLRWTKRPSVKKTRDTYAGAGICADSAGRGYLVDKRSPREWICVGPDGQELWRNTFTEWVRSVTVEAANNRLYTLWGDRSYGVTCYRILETGSGAEQ